MSRQDWCTPPSIFVQLSRDFGPFDLDCAADGQNKLCGRFYTERDNALLQPWDVAPGKRWFVNVPFGDPAPWVAKAISERRRGNFGVMLCLGQLSAEWFRTAWANAHLLIPDRRINYWHPDECPIGRGFDRDSVIFLFGKIAGEAESYHAPPHGEEVRRLWAEANGQLSLIDSRQTQEIAQTQ